MHYVYILKCSNGFYHGCTNNLKDRIKRHTSGQITRIGEYVVYRKDGVFTTECIEWRIKSETRQGGNLSYSQKFNAEGKAILAYDELLEKWENKL